MNLDLLKDRLSSIDAVSGELLYLWGKPGSGCSHLLRASCEAVSSIGLRTGYYDLSEWANKPFDPHGVVMDFDLIAIDDLDTVLEHSVWQELLYHLFNAAQDEGRALIFSSKAPPGKMNWKLRDLQTRLCTCLIMHVKPLANDHLEHYLQAEFAKRKIFTNQQIVDYILHRTERTPRTLLRLVEKLDQASLEEKRKITLPFVREQLGAIL